MVSMLPSIWTTQVSLYFVVFGYSYENMSVKKNLATSALQLSFRDTRLEKR